MIFVRFNGQSCQEGVDLRALDRAIAAIRQAHPGKSMGEIRGWTVLQWEPQVGSGRIQVQGGPDIEVADRSPTSDERRSQPFFLPAPSTVNLVPDNPAYPPVQIHIDANGNLQDIAPTAAIAASRPSPA